MKRASIVFLLLVAIALGMSAGPHPCHGMAAPRSGLPAMAGAGHASCHGDPPPQAPSRPGHDCCDPVKGGHALCDQACQGTAVLGVAPALPAVHSFDELSMPVPDRAASLVVLSIDHVPLA